MSPSRTGASSKATQRRTRPERHAEMRDGFRSVDERLKSLERDVNLLWTESKHHTAAITGLTERVASLEKRVDSMSDDMRQRFRLVIERIAGLEQTPR